MDQNIAVIPPYTQTFKWTEMNIFMGEHVWH